MAQYELLLPVNISATGVEFSEKAYLLGKGEILIGCDSGPVVLNAGDDGYAIVFDSQSATGVKMKQLKGGAFADIGTGSSDVARGIHLHEFGSEELPVSRYSASLPFDNDYQYYLYDLHTLNGPQLQLEVNVMNFKPGKRSIICITGDGESVISFASDFKIIEGEFNPGLNVKNVIEMVSGTYGTAYVGTEIFVLTRIYQL
jgi:hypothetical protein